MLAIPATMAASVPTLDTIDRVAGTRLGAMWFLACLGVVAAGIVLLPPTNDHKISGPVWLAVAIGSLGTFTWAWFERRRTREFLQWLIAHRAEFGSADLNYRGQVIFRDTSVVQYHICISLMLFTIQLHMAPRLKASFLVPSIVTALFGWWAIPWGPVHTVSAIVSNVRGGRSRTVNQLLAELSREPSEVAPWWRRALALDTGDTVQIAANGAIALVLVVLIVLILVAIVRAMLYGHS